MRGGAFALAALLLASAMPAGLTSDARAEERAYLVFAGGADALGLRVVDDYGSFATALLSPEEAERLAAQGVRAEPLDTTLRRGAWVLEGSDAGVPPALRAEPGSPFWLVQFRGPVKEAWRALLAEHSLRVYDSLPNFAFAAKLAPGQAERLAARPEVAFVGPYHPAYKLSPLLPEQGRAEVAVLVFPGEPLEPAILAVLLAGGEIRSVAALPLDGIVKASVPAERLPEVARVPEVSWIEPALDGITLDNDQASAIAQTGQLGNYRVHDLGVDGSSQRVSICDTGVATNPALPFQLLGNQVRRMRHDMYDDPQNPMLWADGHPLEHLNNHRKVAKYYPSREGARVGGDFTDTNGHGTHTAGTLAGDVPPYGVRNDFDGVAYAAKLLVCDITNGDAFHIANDYSVYWDPAFDAGARINSNSWGSPHTNDYTEKARMHDAYVWDHRDFLIFRSMGNTGPNGMMRPEAVAKSALGIGATVNGAGMEDLASFSTRGPTTDGRIKPNVIAPGACLNSAGTGKNNYVCLQGTSMSTPTAAGSAALVRDYYAKGYYPTGAANAADALDPSNALVRATLQISGKRITGSGSGVGFPNGAQGWGRVLLDDALFFAGDARKLFAEDEGAGLATGETKTFMLAVGAGQPLRVMLAWSDRPGAAGANPALVNDLDLEVASPLGTHLGNAFVDGEVPANQGVRDARNVEEAVYLNNPPAGMYTITVRGTNVPDGPQPFALVATHG